VLRQLYIAQSLDGFVADEEGGVRWLEEAGEGGDFGYDEFFRGVGAVVLGSEPYQQLRSWGLQWPYPDLPNWVFTRRELRPAEGADIRFVRGAPSEHDAEIDASAGEKNVWLVGGGDLVRQFVDERLLDELILFVAPLLLGRGIPLFEGTVPTAAVLTEVKAYPPTGFAELRYRFDREEPSGA
jgi:dihydrofolate reductase